MINMQNLKQAEKKKYFQVLQNDENHVMVSNKSETNKTPLSEPQTSSTISVWQLNDPFSTEAENITL